MPNYDLEMAESVIAAKALELDIANKRIDELEAIVKMVVKELLPFVSLDEFSDIGKT